MPSTMLQNDYSGIPINSGVTNLILLFQQHRTLLDDWGKKSGGCGECGVCGWSGSGQRGRGAESVPILPALGLCEALRVLSSNRLVLCMHTH